MLDEVTFEAETHTYRYAGRVVPSVTQALAILNDFTMVNPAVLEAARQFGSNVHAAIDLYNWDELDEETLDPALRPYLDEWIQFRADTDFELIDSEIRVFSKIPLYAGTADVLGKLNGKRCVIDIKTGAVPRTVGLQLAAYAHALPDKPKHRFCLQLSAGSYQLREYKSMRDFSWFQSCLNLWHFQNAGA